jgi:hypothetical protein
LKAVSGFKLATEPFERWLRGCGCRDLELYYYNECDSKKKEVLNNLYKEYKRLNIADVRCIDLFSASEDRKFILNRDKNKKKINELAEMQKEKEKIKING